MNPGDNEPGGWLAVILAAATAGIGVWARRWWRNDRAETQIAGGYASAFSNLRSEVERLSKELSSIAVQLGQERAARREAEEHAIASERRAQELERRNAELERRIAVLELRINGT